MILYNNTKFVCGLISPYILKIISKQNNRGCSPCGRRVCRGAEPNRLQESDESQTVEKTTQINSNDVINLTDNKRRRCDVDGNFTLQCSLPLEIKDSKPDNYIQLCTDYPYVCETCIERISGMKYTFVCDNNQLQSEDEEIDILLALSDAQLGALVKSTWRPGQYKKFKRMLYQAHKQALIVPWRLWSIEERMAFIQHLEDDFVPGEKVVLTHSEDKGALSIDASELKLQSTNEQTSEGGAMEGQVLVAENVSFHDESTGAKLDFASVMDDSMYEDAMPSVELSEFLSRPVLISSFLYSQSSTVGVKTPFSPWYLYFNATPIKKKLDNFAFINCTLKIKIVINSSPFYYGALLFNYEPLSAQPPNVINTDANGGELIPHSQRPHIWVFPQTSQGGEMKLPFFYLKNWLNAGSAVDLQNMGIITPVIYAPLLSANGATGESLTVQIYAWAEDVKLMGPTVNLALQSQDEYGSGPISLPASAIATATGALSNVPIIGRYMRASSIAASALGDVAHLFGYTNVPNIRNVDSFKNQPFPHFASPEISTPIEKLTLDPKNELSIDSRTVGLDGTDEMTVSNIAGKESFLTTGIISLSSAVDYMPFNCVVGNMYSQFAAPPGPYNMLPLSYLSSAFQYWRGDIIFRFRFICTKYHKGRVRITYDPSGNITTTADSYSTAFNRVVDIGEENDVEVVVPYMQDRPWLLCEPSPSVVNYNNGGGTLTRVSGKDNGLITVRVVTPLSAPTTSADVRMQVFVRAGENFEVALPKANLGFGLTLQSEDEISYDLPTRIVAGTNSNNAHPTRYLVNMGENIKSLRQLMRRTTYSHSVFPANVGATDTYGCYSNLMTKYPPFYGYDPNSHTVAHGVSVPASTFGFNFANVTPYNWFAPMFVGQRGSFIWNFNICATNSLSSVSIKKYGNTMPVANNGTYSGTSGALPALSRLTMMTKRDAYGGMSITNQQTQTGLGALLPQYNPNRFTYVNPNNANIGSSVDNTDVEIFEFQADIVPNNTTSSYNNTRIDKYVCIGPDFSLFFWLNVPQVYFLADPS